MSGNTSVSAPRVILSQTNGSHPNKRNLKAASKGRGKGKSILVPPAYVLDEDEEEKVPLTQQNCKWSFSHLLLTKSPTHKAGSTHATIIDPEDAEGTLSDNYGEEDDEEDEEEDEEENETRPKKSGKKRKSKATSRKLWSQPVSYLSSSSLHQLRFCLWSSLDNWWNSYLPLLSNIRFLATIYF